MISTGREMSNLNNSNDNAILESELSLSNFENLSKMSEILIKHEDARLDYLETILKSREKILQYRARGELACLEIEKIHLYETGKSQEASFIKKKQEEILLNHEKEKHELQRLKKIQEEASEKKKVILREQISNLIRQQLSLRERRHSGPLKEEHKSKSPICELPVSSYPVCNLQELDSVCKLSASKSPVCEFEKPSSPVGKSATTREEASENVAKDVLEVLMNKAKYSENEIHINKNFPVPPKTWVQPSPNTKVEQIDKSAGTQQSQQQAGSRGKAEATAVLSNSFAPGESVKENVEQGSATAAIGNKRNEHVSKDQRSSNNSYNMPKKRKTHIAANFVKKN